MGHGHVPRFVWLSFCDESCQILSRVVTIDLFPKDWSAVAGQSSQGREGCSLWECIGYRQSLSTKGLCISLFKPTMIHVETLLNPGIVTIRG